MIQDSTDLSHSERLLDLIVNEIRQKGPIPFIDFMARALYTPELGYYMGEQIKLGREGDFTTAPELTPIFSECVARQCAQILNRLPGNILECGAGTGKMAAHILKTLDTSAALPESYLILEISPNLKRRQQETLKTYVPHLIDRVKWIDTLDGIHMQGVILGNELLDALPIHRFKYQNNEILEAYVDVLDRGLTSQWRQATPSLADKINDMQIDFEDGYESEYNPHIDEWIKKLSSVLVSGAIFFMDYGFPRHEYYHPDRSQGTLMCHYRHLGHTNPLLHIGMQDMTTHVDFTAVANAAAENSLKVAGFTNQASFLLSCGLVDILQHFSQVDYLQICNQVKILTSPNEMGELFKIIALTKAVDFTLLGFKERNKLEKL